MDNRDRDKMSGDMSKDDSESSVGKNIGRSEEWNDESKSSWKGDSGRTSSGGSRSDLGEQSDVDRSRDRSQIEH